MERGTRDEGTRKKSGAIIPEDPVGAGCFLLGIGLEDLFSIRPFEGSKFVSVQRGMPQIGFKKPQTIPDSFENIFLRGIFFNRPKVGIGLRGEDQLLHQSLFGVLGKRSALDGALLRESGEDFL
jgi:hypothetical protein